MGRWWHIEANGLHLHRKRPCRRLPFGRSEFRVGLGHWVFVLQAIKGKGICTIERFRRALGRDGDPLALKWRYPSMKKRMTKTALEGGVKHLAAMETTRFADLMPLVEHCAVRVYDDGDPREPGWFTVKVNGAAWVIQVKDPDGSVSFAATADTLDKALETAALLLACDEAPWEDDRYLKQQKATRSRK